jgi:hypothetical protein
MALAEPLSCTGPIVPKKSQRIRSRLPQARYSSINSTGSAKCVLQAGVCPLASKFNVKGSTHKTEQGVWYKQGWRLCSDVGQRIEDIRLFFDSSAAVRNKHDRMAEGTFCQKHAVRLTTSNGHVL